MVSKHVVVLECDKTYFETSRRHSCSARGTCSIPLHHIGGLAMCVPTTELAQLVDRHCNAPWLSRRKRQGICDYEGVDMIVEGIVEVGLSVSSVTSE